MQKTAIWRFCFITLRGIEHYMFSTHFGYFVSTASHKISQNGFDSSSCFLKKTVAAGSSTNENSAIRRFFHLCSHQESNLDRRYRKPAFYPLNYESEPEDTTTSSSVCHLVLKTEELEKFVCNRLFKTLFRKPRCNKRFNIIDIFFTNHFSNICPF